MPIWRYSIALCLATVFGSDSSFAQSSGIKFDVVSVRSASDGSLPVAPQRVGPTPGRLFLSDTVEEMIRRAYDMERFQVTGGPDWARRTRFEVDARTSPATATPDNLRSMLRSLLEDRFKLVVHIEQREMRTLTLSIAKADRSTGSSLTACESAEAPGRAKPLPVAPKSRPFSGICQPMNTIAKNASQVLDTMVINSTGLHGLWSYGFVYAPPSDFSADTSLPSFITAMEEQLGLKLESSRDTVPVLVIDSVAAPTEN